MRGIVRSLLPLPVAVGAVSALTLYLLGGADPSVGRWILAALLFAHGWVHLMFAFPRPPRSTKEAVGTPEWPFDLDDSWLVSRRRLPAARVRAIGLFVVVVTFAGFLLAAFSTVGILVPAAWWPGLVLGSAGSSAVLLGACFSPALLLGLAIDAALAWLVIWGAWSPIAG